MPLRELENGADSPSRSRRLVRGPVNERERHNSRKCSHAPVCPPTQHEIEFLVELPRSRRGQLQENPSRSGEANALVAERSTFLRRSCRRNGRSSKYWQRRCEFQHPYACECRHYPPW